MLSFSDYILQNYFAVLILYRELYFLLVHFNNACVQTYIYICLCVCLCAYICIFTKFFLQLLHFIWSSFAPVSCYIVRTDVLCVCVLLNVLCVRGVDRDHMDKVLLPVQEGEQTVLYDTVQPDGWEMCKLSEACIDHVFSTIITSPSLPSPPLRHGHHVQLINHCQLFS